MSWTMSGLHLHINRTQWDLCPRGCQKWLRPQNGRDMQQSTHAIHEARKCRLYNLPSRKFCSSPPPSKTSHKPLIIHKMSTYTHSMEAADYLAHLFHHALAKENSCESLPPSPIPPKWMTAEYLDECQGIVAQLVEALMKPGMYTHLAFILPP